MELTAAQRRIVEHGDGPLRITGAAGTGKTTSLVERYSRLVSGGERPSSVLVVCHDRAAATRFRDAVLPRLSGGFDALPITTWFGVAFDLVVRARGPVRLVSTADQRALVRRLLAGESPADWPEHGRYLGRDAFAEEVAGALLDVGPGVFPEVDRFRARYTAALAERGLVDRTGLLAAATASTADGPARYAHVLVDDHIIDTWDGLLAAMAGPAASAAVVSGTALPWPAPDVTLSEAFRHPAPPVLVTCRHPSMEPEAVAGELLAARSEGVPWSGMAVLVRSPSSQGRPIARTLSRNGIPVAPGPGTATAAGASDPAVAAIVDMLRWVAGDEAAGGRLEESPLSVIGTDGVRALHDDLVERAATSTPGDLAFTVWAEGLAHLVAGATADDASLDAVVAFLDRLERRADDDPSERLPDLLAALDAGEVTPDPWRVTATGERAAVTITSIDAALGREWHTVVVAGCVEGQLPRITGRAPLFDPSPAPPAERRRSSLAAERAVFARACSRSTSRLVAVAAPAPGVLLSRFVEGWTTRDARPPAFRGPAPAPRPATENPVEVFPDGRLSLSASQLSAYDTCPLRYSYKYGLRVPEAGSVDMELGTLVHKVLAEFLRPGRDGARTRDELLAIAVDLWSDDIARYRPQVEECRRDYYAMLDAWWEGEGSRLRPDQVLAVERGFDIQAGDVRLTGSIDRVDRTADGEGICIVDYKTGKTEPRPDSLPDDLQLAVYHLAAVLDPALAALGPPRRLSLLFIRTMHVFEQPIVAEHAENTRARIAAAAAAIRAEQFEPSVEADCRTCSFHRLCPLQRAGRQVAVA